MDSLTGHWARSLILLFIAVTGLTGMLALTHYSVSAVDNGVIDHDTLTSIHDDLNIGVGGRICCILFYHPRCPCTMATIRMLERRICVWPQRPHVVAVAWVPTGENSGWADSSATRALQKIRGIRIVHDFGGVICQRHAINASGHVLVLGPQGELRFSGGITSYRGHEGPGSAAASFETAVTSDGRHVNCTYWPVLGCTF